MYSIGIDLGGTNIKGVITDEKGAVLHWYNGPTGAENGPLYVMKRMKQVIDELMGRASVSNAEIKGIGIGLPGQVDPVKGIAIFLPNLPGWSNIPVRSGLEKVLDIKVKIENDVRMAAWGEKLLGAGRGIDDFICLALGTGIGSGIFVSGRMLLGRNRGAGEIGHISVIKDGPLCSCGNRGCLEMYASGRAIAQRAAEILKTGQRTLMSELVKDDISKISSLIVKEAASKGDKPALDLISSTAEYLGIGLVTLANLLNPQRIALGGGVMGLGDMLLAPIRENVSRCAMPLNKEVDIVAAQLGEKAGALGAAEVIRQNGIESID